MPFAPGGQNDVFARALVEGLHKKNIKAIVINKPGASGFIGANYVKKSEPDGYTLLIASSSTMVYGPILEPEKFIYDSLVDFEPISFIGKSPLLFVASKKSNIIGIPELIKANNVSYAIPAPFSKLAVMQFLQFTKTNGLIVPYSGSMPALLDVINGSTDISVDTIIPALSYSLTNMVVPIAVTSNKRLSSLPNVPTLGEFLPKFDMYSWSGIVAPAKTPKDITNTLNLLMNNIIQEKEFKELLIKFNCEEDLMSTKEFSGFLTKEMNKWKLVIHGK